MKDHSKLVNEAAELLKSGISETKVVTAVRKAGRVDSKEAIQIIKDAKIKMVAKPKTVAEFKAEAEAAAKALREAEEAARQAERDTKEAEHKAKVLAETKQKQATKGEILIAFHKALVTHFKGATLDIPPVTDPYSTKEPKVTLAKDQNYPCFTVQPRRTADTWHPQFIGWGIALTFEPYGKTRIYPELSKGGYSYDKIIKVLKDHIAAEANAEAHKKMVAKKSQSSIDFANKVKAKLGVDAKSELITGEHESGSRDYRGRWSGYTTRPAEGKVYVNLGRRECTPEQAAILVKALAEVQKLEPKKE